MCKPDELNPPFMMVKLFGTSADRITRLATSRACRRRLSHGWFYTFLLILTGWLTYFPHVFAGSGPFYAYFFIVDAGPDVTICKGDTVQLTASGASTYEWSPATGLSCTNCSSPRATPLITTTYYILANDGSLDSIRVTVLEAPVFSPVNNVHPTDCGLNDGSITINATGDSILEYSKDGGQTWSANKIFTGLGEGDYNINVRYANTRCQTAYPFGTVVLQAEHSFFIQSISTNHPTGCNGSDGVITINASTDNLQYSIDAGANYQTEKTFSGLKAGTYPIKVQKTGSSCFVASTTQLFVQKGCPDTLHVIIPPSITSTYCIDTSVFEIAGKVTASAICGFGDPLSVRAISIDSTCLTLMPANGFKGTSPALICVVNCFNNNLGACDTTYLRVTVSDGNCSDIFAQDTMAVPFSGNPTPVCIPLPPAKASKYTILLNDNPIGNFDGCRFDSVLIYAYSFIPGAGVSGPYKMESWTVDGIPYEGAFINVNDLAGLMNLFDPAGNWQLDTGTGIIFGGNLKSTYGNMRVRHIPTSASSVIQASLSILPAGFNINLTSVELHKLVAIEPFTGCSDTLYINLPIQKTTTERVSLSTLVNVPSASFCLTALELPDKKAAGISLCKQPTKGSVSFLKDTCLIYTPNPGFTGLDTFCVILCSNTTPQVCDTTFFTVRVYPQKDTLNLTIKPGSGKVDTCLLAPILGISGSIIRAEFCGLKNTELTGTLQSNCISLSAVDGFYGDSEVCVIHCDNAICDTTILQVKVLKPEDCAPLFQNLEINAAVQGDSSFVCLPLPFNKSADYKFLLDGKIYNRAIEACDKDLVYRYNWGAVFGQGKDGPYNISWLANGGTFSGVVQNMSGLRNLLNSWDPPGLWVLDTLAQSLISSNDNGLYGTLSIIHVASGSASNLQVVQGEIAYGSLIKVTGEGIKQVVLVHNQSGCRDTILIRAIAGAKVLNIKTVENVPSRAECLDTTGLFGKFLGIGICKSPANGTIITNGNCFTYNPPNGFIGKDQACLTVCDDRGKCDTVLLFISVDPLCSLFDFFPSTVQNFIVDSCSAMVPYCVPVRMDSLVKFAITDNGFPYMAGFNYCNGNQAQMKLDTGFHTIVFRHLTTGCIDTLKANVRCKAQLINCGVYLIGTSEVVVPDCADKATVCFNLLFAEKDKYKISLNGQPLGSATVTCGLNNSFTGIALDTGSHTLIFRDTTLGCADTIKVNVSCPKPLNVILDRNLTLGDSITVCLSDQGYDISKIDSIVAICPPPAVLNAAFRLDRTSWCLTAKGLVLGRDTACYRVFGRGIAGTITLRVNVVPQCMDWFVKDTIRTISSSCIAGFGQFCIPLSPTDIKGKDVEINGKRYSGDFLPCKFDSLYILNYNELPGRGLSGPYILERWTINGILFNGEFTSASQLLALMLAWDPNGKWETVVDPSGQATLIRGGNPQNIYGPMHVTQKNTGIKTLLGINSLFMPVSVSLPLPPGMHKVKISDPLTGCVDSVVVGMGCITTSTFRDSLSGGKSKTYCLDLSELPGQVTNITEVCGAQQAGIVGIQIISNCITVTGLKNGLQTICVLACDNLGFCDTTKLSITVIGNAQLIPVAANDTIKGKQETPVNIPVLSNDKYLTLTSRVIQKPPSFGTASFQPDGTVSYEPDKGYCDEKTPDSFTYTLCSTLGCDTATVFVTVECKTLEVFNAFSPNGDGINDFFIINGLQNFPNHRLQVYNRWGNIVLDTIRYKNDWAGIWDGKEVPDGTYYYVLDLGDGTKPKSGYLQLRR